ncbi:MAG: site-specific integrase, partial [Bacteroidales bacterium]|nr:site-specific integrase [Bacteroidales bacterium]
MTSELGHHETLASMLKDDVWKGYLRDFQTHLRLEKGMAENSIRAYMVDVCHLAKFAQERKLAPAEVATANVEKMLVELNESDVAVASQCRMLSAWRMFYKMLLMGGEVKENPVELVEMPRHGKHLPDVLTNDDIDAMEATFDMSLPDQARNCVIMEVLYGCGLRVSELTNLRLNDIYEDEECLLVTGKGDKQRWVPINH